MRASILATVCAAIIAAPASAAFIAIDDSDLDTITITAGDFEGGFSVNGVLLTAGLGESGSITLDDGGHGISGSWIDLGEGDRDRLDIEFALAGAPADVTSGIEFDATSDGSFATLEGSFGGFTGATYFTSGLATLLQNGQIGLGEVAFLTVSFVSEVPAAVPAPAATALFGVGLLGLGLRRPRIKSGAGCA